MRSKEVSHGHRLSTTHGFDSPQGTGSCGPRSDDAFFYAGGAHHPAVHARLCRGLECPSYPDRDRGSRGNSGKPRAVATIENSEDFDIVERVFSDEEMSRAIVAGRARVGIKIPQDYS